MGIKRKEIIELLNTDDATPSLLYWNDLILFYIANKPDLDFEDVQILYDESERCRTYWNLDKIETITIVKNGNEMKMKRPVKGLDIGKEEVYSDLYKYYDYLVDQEEETTEAEDYQVPIALQLIAAPA